MKLYLVHCGFYDRNSGGGVYESHTNFFVAAADFEEARAKAKEISGFQRMNMHVDGIQELQAVNGYDIQLIASPHAATRVLNFRPRGHAPELESY